ncbi:MAG TPA: AbrB/MazE/SpoVT family DNA-binding domain-containing protein [Afifellaceae bacterium]|nr:AbrB/MazE/SpoVT family DNA-binding domain-containing protein [Afifellaceae bacterium]
MSRTTSKLSAAGRVTVPVPVREALDWKPGDLVQFFQIEGDAVRLRRVDAEELAYLRLADESLAEEWLSPEDSEAFDDL